MISILYVDDESALLDIAKLFLERTGQFSVDTATSAPEAIEKIRKNSYEAVISDYQMPEMDGIAFLKILRKEHPKLPFIIFTGKGREEIAVEAFENGADFYVQKGGQPKAQFSELLLKVNAAVQRRRTEKSLLESEEKYRNLIERATDGIVVLQDSLIRYCNQHSAEIMSCSVLELINRPFSDFVAAEELPKLKANYARRMAGEQVPGTYETVLIKKDGSQVFAELNAGIVEYEGKPADMLIIRDITQRKRMEKDLLKKNTDLNAAYEKLNQQDAALQQKEEKFRMIFDTAPNLIMSVNREGIIVDCNQRVRDVLGYEKTEVTGQSLAKILHHEDLTREQDCLAEIMTDGTVYNRHCKMVKKDGHVIDVSINATGIKDKSGRYFRTVCIIDDVTERLAAEETLRATKEKYTKAFHAAPDAIVISEIASGQFVECNDATSIIFGYSHDELIGKSARELGILLNDEDRDALIRQVMAQGRVVQYELVERRKSGELFNASITADTITIGNTRYLITIIRDITQRKRTEDALRASEARYKNVVEDQTEFIARFLPDGTHVFVNEAYLRYFNKTRDEVIGHTFYPDIPKEDQMILKEHIAALTPVNPVATVVHRIIMPDGTVRWQRWSDRALFDKMGTIVEYQSVGRDVTEQKRVEEALRNSDQLMRGIVNHLPDPTFVINDTGEVIAWNKAMEGLTGVRGQDMVGKANYEYSVPFYGKRMPILIDLALHYDEEVGKKYTFVRHEGETLVAETTIAHPLGKSSIVLWGKATPLYDKDGRLSGAIETIRDITERKQEELRLNHAIRQLNLLTSVTRHDILNQLLALKGYLELSHEFLQDPDRLLEFITKEQKIASVIENQITLTQEYDEVGTKAPIWQNVNYCILQAIAHLPVRDIHVAVDCPDLEVFADPLFEKVMYNLIDNALRYGGGQLKEIRVSSHENSENLALVCEDDGAGVSDNEKRHLFERGFGKHTGLGLFLSREILSITNIKIIENGTFGKGARFEITVPKGAYRFSGSR